jgi:hypothetical protein
MQIITTPMSIITKAISRRVKSIESLV